MPTAIHPRTDLPRGSPEGRRLTIGLPPAVRFVVRRLAAGLVTLLIASALIFAAVQVLPGDAADAVLGQQATAERVAAVRADLGLDKPLFQRYVDWLGGTVTGDFGNSTAAAAQGSTVSVWSDIKTPLVNSLILAVIAAVLFIVMSLVIGSWAALRRDTAVDRLFSNTSLGVGAVPEFVIATLLIALFFSTLGLLPPISQVAPGATPLNEPERLVLPVLTLVAAAGSYGIRLVRASMIDVLEHDYVSQARLNGVPEPQVVRKFVLRNALAANIQVLANTMRNLIGGIIIVESVFAYPGIGAKLVSAVSLRDIQEVAGISFILAAAYIVINIAADVVVVLMVPKLRTAQLS